MEEIVCRERQVSLITHLLGKKHHSPPAAFFLYGHTATGKSLVVTSLLRNLQVPHVLVNCVECYSQRFLYEHVLNSLNGGMDTLTEKRELLSCDNMNDFVRSLQRVVIQRGLQGETVYIVLDKAERLRDMEANILPAFLRLRELSGLNVSVLMLSEIVWEKFRSGTGVCEPFVIHFPDYSKDELVEIISRDCPTDYPAGFYNMYVNLVLSIFHYACRDLKELRHLDIVTLPDLDHFKRAVVSLNFDKYVQPIKAGEASTTDTKKLWKNIEPHLKKALQTLYLREVSSSQWERYQQQLETEGTAQLQGLSYRSHVELPFYSKYLLIAAYLASYNPAKSDRKFFAKHSGKGKKSKIIKKQDRTSNHMLGPKPFPLDRLMAIFYSIVEGRVAPTANIFMQITSLVSVRFLGQVSGEDQVDQPKYKCLISLDFIKSVGRTVNFEVINYLYDFV